MIFEHSDYRHFLKTLLHERRTANHAYSLRAMAQNIGVSASTLSDVMAQKKNFSEETALEVAGRLKLTTRQKKYFCTLVRYEAVRDAELKNVLTAQLRVLNPKLCNYFDLKMDCFNLMADWYHTAILEMTYLENFKITPLTISQSLGITINEAKQALDLLIRLELINEISADEFSKFDGQFQAHSKVPNEALCRYHYQMLSKAQESLRSQLPSEKFVGSETIPLWTQQVALKFNCSWPNLWSITNPSG